MFTNTELKDDIIVGILTHNIIHALGFSASLYDRLGKAVNVRCSIYVCMCVHFSDTLMKMVTTIIQLWIF